MVLDSVKAIANVPSNYEGNIEALKDEDLQGVMHGNRTVKKCSRGSGGCLITGIFFLALSVGFIIAAGATGNGHFAIPAVITALTGAVIIAASRPYTGRGYYWRPAYYGDPLLISGGAGLRVDVGQGAGRASYGTYGHGRTTVPPTATVGGHVVPGQR